MTLPCFLIFIIQLIFTTRYNNAAIKMKLANMKINAEILKIS